jgi:two-component system cell cycle response regulator DivK
MWYLKQGGGPMKKKILLVEDNPDTIDLMQSQLDVLGYDSINIDDGLQVVEKAASEMPDMILMDIVLPNLNGLEAASRIRKNPKTQSIPILAVSAWAIPGVREKCFEAGCDDYIEKPVTRHELGAAIKNVLK